jgi:hypothetical protein
LELGFYGTEGQAATENEINRKYKSPNLIAYAATLGEKTANRRTKIFFGYNPNKSGYPNIGNTHAQQEEQPGAMKVRSRFIKYLVLMYRSTLLLQGQFRHPRQQVDVRAPPLGLRMKAQRMEFRRR